MSTTVNLYSRDGSKLIFSETFAFDMSQGGIYFDTEVGIAKIVLSDGSTSGSVCWYPNTSNFAGIAGSPNKTQADFEIYNTDNTPLYYTPIWNIYEAYEGNEAESGYTLTLNTENGFVMWNTSFFINNVIHNVVSLPDPLPTAYKQTIGGGFLSLVNWYYNTIYTEIAYPDERLDGDTTLYAVYTDIGVDINIYDSTGTTLKAVGRYVDTLTSLSLYRIADNYELFVNANAQDYTIDWSIVAGYELLGLAREVGGEIWLTMGQTKETPIMTYGTINLYEVEESVQPPDSFSITYVTNGGTLEEDFPNPQTDLQNIPEFLPTCTKARFVFDGWYLDSSFENPVILGEPLTQNISLYAKFSPLLTIDITLFQNKSENNRVNKKPYLAMVKTMRGTFRQSVDILNPVITIEAEDLPQFNYVHISSFSRYYFVTSITNINTGIWQISCKCDVLYSYESTIRSQVAFIARNENEFNSLINDDEVVVNLTSDVNRTYINVDSGSKWVSSDRMLKNDNKKRFLMAMQGYVRKKGSSEAVPQAWGLAHIMTHFLGYVSFMHVVTKQTTGIFTDKLMTDLLYSLKVFPFELDNEVTIDGGNWLIDAGMADNNLVEFPQDSKYPDSFCVPKANFIYTHTWEFTITKPHSLDYENYLNYTPYTSIWLQFMPFGRFEIDTKLLFKLGNKAKLTVKTKTNILTGESQLFWKTGDLTNVTELYLGTANVSTDLPYSATAFANTKVISGSLSVLTGVATALAGNALGGGAALYGAVAGGSAMASGTLQTLSALSTPTTSISGGNINMVDSAPTIIMETKRVAGSSPSTLGRPLYKERKLNNLTGFTKVLSVNLNGFNTATESEVSVIESQLKSGVIL